MQGSIFEIKRFAVHDGPGVRTTVFFKGCPLRCLWCHNPEGIGFGEELAYLPRRCVGCGECVSACPEGLHAMEDGAHTFSRAGCTLCFHCQQACMPGALKRYGTQYSAQELLALMLPDRDFYAQSGGGVTCSGGEPLSQAAFVAEFLAACKQHGLHTAVDTSGYAAWEAFEAVLPHTDLFLYDLKHMDDARHQELTGVSNRPILENARRLSALSAPIEVRVPVIPGLNDDADNIEKTGAFLLELASLTKARPLPYHALSGSKYQSIGMAADMPAVLGNPLSRATEVAGAWEGMGIPVARPG